MIDQPFLGPKLKVIRARQLSRELEAEIAAFLGREPWAALLERDRETGQHQIAYRGREGIPAQIPLIFGDTIHNLRVALDLLANEIVAFNGTEPRNVYFPFAKSQERFEAELKRKMQGASADCLAIIRSLKPYSGGNEALRALHDLDIRDKHIDFLEVCAGGHVSNLTMVQVPTGHPARWEFRADIAATPTVPIDTTGFHRTAAEARRLEIVGKVADSGVEIGIAKSLPLAGRPAIDVVNKLGTLVLRIVQIFEAHCLGDKKPGTAEHDRA